MNATPEQNRKVGEAVLRNLEDRRDVKRPLQALRWSNDPIDREVYAEIQEAIGRIARAAIAAEGCGS